MELRAFLFTGIIFSFSGTCYGQQQATLSQYMFNGIAINPAYAGSHGALSFNFLSRFQNIGLPGAPNTQTFAVHSPLANERMSLGFMVIHDKITITDQTGISAIYAYGLPMPFGGKLSLGLQAGIGLYKAQYTALDIYQSDPAFQNDVREARPNFGAGVYYYNSRLYAGISMPHLMNNVFDRGNQLTTVYQSIPFIVTGGIIFDISPMLKLKPNLLFKMVDGRAVELDLNASVLFNEFLWVGVSYKFVNAVTLLTEIKFKEQLRIGYSYSITTGPVSKAELGSHELYLSYRLKFLMNEKISASHF